MRRNILKLNHAPSAWVAQTLSILATILISISLLAVASLLLINGVIKETGIKYTIMIIHFIATFFGLLFTVNIVNEKFLVHATITALGYTVINILMKIMIGGQWRKEVILMYAAILAAYTLSCLIIINRKNKK